MFTNYEDYWLNYINKINYINNVLDNKINSFFDFLLVCSINEKRNYFNILFNNIEINKFRLIIEEYFIYNKLDYFFNNKKDYAINKLIEFFNLCFDKKLLCYFINNYNNLYSFNNINYLKDIDFKKIYIDSLNMNTNYIKVKFIDLYNLIKFFNIDRV